MIDITVLSDKEKYDLYLEMRRWFESCSDSREKRHSRYMKNRVELIEKAKSRYYKLKNNDK